MEQNNQILTFLLLMWFSNKNIVTMMMDKLISPKMNFKVILTKICVMYVVKKGQFQ